MSGAGLLAEIRFRGVEVRVDGGALVLSPRSAVPRDLRDRVTAHKLEVIEALRAEPPAGGVLLDGGRSWIPSSDRHGWCPCDERLAWDAKSGLCRNCFSAVYGDKIRVTVRGDPPRIVPLTPPPITQQSPEKE